MRHARKPIVFNAATSRERSDRVESPDERTRSLRSRLVCGRQGAFMERKWRLLPIQTTVPEATYIYRATT